MTTAQGGVFRLKRRGSLSGFSGIIGPTVADEGHAEEVSFSR
jgi:hypothetical protein